jgi:hypothetical protein
MVDEARHLREDPALRPVELSDVDVSDSSDSSDGSGRNSARHHRRQRPNRTRRTPSPPPPIPESTLGAGQFSPFSSFASPPRNQASNAALLGHLDAPQSPLALAERDYAMRDLRASLTELARVHDDLKRRLMRSSSEDATCYSPLTASAGLGAASPTGNAAPPSAAHPSASPAADELAAHIRALTAALEEAKAMAARTSVPHPQDRSDPIAVASPAAVEKKSSPTTSIALLTNAVRSPSPPRRMVVPDSTPHSSNQEILEAKKPAALIHLLATVASTEPVLVRSPVPAEPIAVSQDHSDAFSLVARVTQLSSPTADGRGESPPWRPRMLPTPLNNHPRSMKGSVMKGILAAAAVEQARRAAQQYQAQPQTELPPNSSNNSSSVNNHMGNYLGMPAATQLTTLAQRAKKERRQWPSLEQLLVASRAGKAQSQPYMPSAAAGTDVASPPVVSSSALLPSAASGATAAATALSSQGQQQPHQHQHHLSPEEHAREVRAVARVRQFTELQARKASELSRSPQRSTSPSRPPIPPAPVRSTGPLSLPLLSPHSMPVVILPGGGSAGVAAMPGSVRRRGRRGRRSSVSSSSADNDADDDGVDNGNEEEDPPSSNRSTPAHALSPAVQSRQGVVNPASLGQSDGLPSPSAQVPEDPRALLRDGDIAAASRGRNGRGRRSRGGPSPSTAPRSPAVKTRKIPSTADGGDPLLLSSSRRSSVDSSSGATSSRHSSETSSPMTSDADTEVEAEEEAQPSVDAAAVISPRVMQSRAEPVSDLSSGRDFLSVPGSSMLSHPLPSVAEESGSNLSASPPLPTQTPNLPPPSSHPVVVAVPPLKSPAVTELHASSSAPPVRYSPRMNPVAPAPVLGQTPFAANHPHVPVTAADTVVSPLSPSSRAEARRLDELRRYEQENAPSSPAVVQAVIDALIPPSLQLAPPSPRQGPRPRSPAPDVVFSASASPQVHSQQQQQDNDLPDLQLANSTSPPSVGFPAHSVLADGADPSSVPISRADLVDLQAAVASLDAARRAREEAQALEWTRQFEAKWAEKQSRHARRSGGGGRNQHHQYLHTNARSSGPVRNNVAISPGISSMTALARSMSQPSNLMTLRDPRALVAEMDLMSPSNGGGGDGVDAVTAAIAGDSTGEDNGAVDGGSNGMEPAVLSPRSLLQLRLNNERASVADAKQRTGAFSSRWNGGGGGGGGGSSARLAVPAGVPDVDIADPLELPLSSSPESEISASPPPFGQGTGNNAEAGANLDGTAAPVSQSLRSRASFRRRMQDLALQGQFFLKSATGSSPISNGVSSPPPFSGGHVLHDLGGSTATPPTLGQHPAQLYGYVSSTDGGAAGASSPLAVITPSVSSPMLMRGEPPICAAGEGPGGGSGYRAPPPQGTVLHALANSHALSSVQLLEKA